MKKFEFEGSQGHALAARLDEPEGKIKAYALFAHCFTCSKDIFAAGHIAKALTQNNIAVVRFDFTGLGSSEGDFANTNFTSNVEDLIKAADYMREHMQAPSILIGHSLGGAAVLVAANHIPEAKAVATLGAPADSAHVAHHFMEKREEIMEKGEAEVCLVGRPFKIKKQFIDDIEDQNMKSSIGSINKALIIMHAPLDQTVGIENAETIFKAAKHPKSFISLDDADHLLSRKEDAQYAGHVIANWAARYIR
jgi:putative redox protein